MMGRIRNYRSGAAIASEEKSHAEKIQGKMYDMVKKSLEKYPPKK